ncbi:MAG: plastocyanin/azurin family copper-binding protein [Limisphaerales bacterium]
MRNLNVLFITSLALPLLLASGCGSGSSDSSAASQSQGAAPQMVAAAPTGKVHDVAMRGEGSRFFFEPKEITIQRGDTIRWKMVDGAPHNVNFTGHKIPEGARVVLANKKKLMGVMLAGAGQTYEIQFTDDFPLGEYNYVCDPHIAFNMVGKITLTEKTAALASAE